MTAEDIEYVLGELDAWKLGERGTKLTWGLIEKISGKTRQTLCKKPEIMSRFEQAKHVLRGGVKPRVPPGPEIERLRMQVDRLRRDLEARDTRIAAWQELWLRYEYNATVHGWDADKLRMPLPPKAGDKST